MTKVAIDRQEVTLYDEVLTLGEAAAYLKLAERTVHRMIQREEIPCAKVGGQWRFMKSVLDDWLLSRMQVLPRNELAPLLDAAGGAVRLAPMVSPSLVVDRITAGAPKDVLEQLVQPLVSLGVVQAPARYVELLLSREQLSSTAIGLGVAVPHVRRIKDNPPGAPPVILGVCRAGTEFNAPDERPVHFFFLLSTTSEVVHLRLLKRITLLFRDRTVRDSLLKSDTPAGLLEALSLHEEHLFPGGQ